ncbi:MAG TPA: FadR/GntR family transcriptional regulator [Conexibacter sp.]
MSERTVLPRPLSMDQPIRGLHGQAVQQLGREIIAGRRAPGELLDPEQLETELGVSRTVVREALRVLTAKGLLAARPKVGTHVRERSEWRMLDPDVLRWRYETATDFAFLDSLAEVRQIIEPAGAALAAQRRTDADLATLREALSEMERAHAARDAEAATASDLVFHRALLAAGHNELLEQMEMVIAAGLRVRDRLVHERPDWDDATPDHAAVLEAVQARDADRARERMEALLERGVRDAKAARAAHEASQVTPA